MSARAADRRRTQLALALVLVVLGSWVMGSRLLSRGPQVPGAARASLGAAGLRFVRLGATVATLELPALLRLAAATEVAGLDPYYERRKRFQALPLEPLLTAVFGETVTALRQRDFVLRARDGYAVPLPGSRLLEGGAVHVLTRAIDRVVVLATDGQPNCNDTDVTGRINRLFGSKPSVRTFVIGVGDGSSITITGINLTGGTLIMQLDSLATGPQAITEADNAIMYMNLGLPYTPLTTDPGTLTIATLDTVARKVTGSFEVTLQDGSVYYFQALVMGFPVLLQATSRDLGATGGVIILAVTLTRAPLLVPLTAMQGNLIAHFVDERGHRLRALVSPVALVAGVGAVGVTLAYLLGPWLLRVGFGEDYVTSGALLGWLTAGAVAIAVLTVTGAATVAAALHRAYSLGWVGATVAAAGLLMLPMELEHRAIVALLCGPLIGIAVHVAALAVSGRR